MTNTVIGEADYLHQREVLLDQTDKLIELEHKYMYFLQEAIADVSPRIFLDFSKATTLLPFWKNYPPIQRGHHPSGTSVPWSEVGETAIGANVIRALVLKDSEITYPGLPSGADIRFLTNEALIHFDVKITGPNDRADEVVASPNQISGDGINWHEGVINSPVTIIGKRTTMLFQPELPPFYIIDGDVVPCLTYFLKGLYSLEKLGYQPLLKLELICVPNGLLAFDGPKYVQNQGLFIPGKDEKGHAKKRVRVRMNPLALIAAWRRTTIWE